MSQTLIIAEAGINMNRSVDEAKCLVDAAQEAGADIFKMQCELPQEGKPVYTLTWDETIEVYAYCRKVKMQFVCTAFDCETLDFLLQRCVMPFLKIASCDAENVPLIALALSSGKPIIQSLKRGAVKVVGDKAKYLHVVAEYPTPAVHADLKRLREPGISGLSDHSQGITIPIAAVAMGAKIIEKHLTMRHNAVGPDHQSSLEPYQFRQMVRAIREVEEALA